jgi:uracil-DNA glycosylase
MMVAMATIPDIPLRPGTYREALFETIKARVGERVPAADLPGPTGTGANKGAYPIYAAKRLNQKLTIAAEAGGDTYEVRVFGPNTRVEAVGLFEIGRGAAGWAPQLSPRAAARSPVSRVPVSLRRPVTRAPRRPDTGAVRSRRPAAEPAAPIGSDPRLARLDEPHVRPLMDLLGSWETAGRSFPNIDPMNGGVNAKVLFLQETPGPGAVRTGFVSRSNRDPTAQNAGKALDQAGFAWTDYLRWNVVPYYISSGRNANASGDQIREAAHYAQAFLDVLTKLRVVVFCGLQAQKQIKFLRLRPGVAVLTTWHCGAQSFNHADKREEIFATFREAYKLMNTQGPFRVSKPGRGTIFLSRAATTALGAHPRRRSKRYPTSARSSPR